MILSHKDHVKLTLPGHTGEVPRACSNGQHASLVVPADWDHRIQSLLIGTAVPAVFIQIETAISTSINAQLDGCVRLFAGIFDFWAKRQN